MNTTCSIHDMANLKASIFQLIFFASCFFYLESTAQEFKGILIIGATAAQIDGDDLGGFDKAGFQIGGGVSFPLSEKVALQPEILFSQKGSKSRRNEPFFNWQLNYIDMPLLIKYRINEQFVVHAGAAANYLLSARFDAGFGFTDQSEAFKQVDFAANAGVEYFFNEAWSANANLVSSVVSAGKFQRYYNRTIHFTLRYHLLPK